MLMVCTYIIVVLLVSCRLWTPLRLISWWGDFLDWYLSIEIIDIYLICLHFIVCGHHIIIQLF